MQAHDITPFRPAPVLLDATAVVGCHPRGQRRPHQDSVALLHPCRQGRWSQAPAFTSSVISRRRGHVGVPDEALHRGDIDPGIEDVRHAERRRSGGEKARTLALAARAWRMAQTAWSVMRRTTTLPGLGDKTEQGLGR